MATIMDCGIFVERLKEAGEVKVGWTPAVGVERNDSCLLLYIYRDVAAANLHHTKKYLYMFSIYFKMDMLGMSPTNSHSHTDVSVKPRKLTVNYFLCSCLQACVFLH